MEGATGAFREQYAKSTEGVIKILEENKSIMTGEVLWTGVVAQDPDSATVIVATSGTVQNKQTDNKPVARYFRLQLELVSRRGQVADQRPAVRAMTPRRTRGGPRPPAPRSPARAGSPGQGSAAAGLDTDRVRGRHDRRPASRGHRGRGAGGRHRRARAPSESRAAADEHDRLQPAPEVVADSAACPRSSTAAARPRSWSRWSPCSRWPPPGCSSGTPSPTTTQAVTVRSSRS